MRTLRTAVAATGLLALLAGCPTGEQWPLRNGQDSSLSVPSGVAAVEDRSDYFSQSTDHPLLAVPAGTVVDNLELLEGCWGAYAGPDGLEGSLLVHADAEFYHFDFGAMRLSYQTLQRGGVLSPVDIVVETVYELRITGPDRITVRATSTGWSTDAPIGSDASGSEALADQEPVDLQITLDGDSFKFGVSEWASSDFSGPHRASLVFRRFDCPE